jgi:hypothetical protein
MKLFGLIVGIVVVVAGVILTGLAWYHAATLGRIDRGAYLGPFLVVVGSLRVIRGMAAIPPNLLLRYAFIGGAVLAGFGHQALLKAIYPAAQSETLTSSQ